MKKIIKHGKIKETETTCTNCGCIFTYEEEDIIQKENSSLTSTSYRQTIVYCPDCGAEIQVYRETFIGTPIYPASPWSPTNPYGGPMVTYADQTGVKCCKGECTCSKQ